MKTRSCTCLTFPLWHDSLSTPERSHNSREVAKRRGGHRRFSPLRRRVRVERRPGPRRPPDAGDDRLQLPRTQLLAAEQGLQSRFDASYEGSTTEEVSPRYTRCGSSFVRSFDVLLRAASLARARFSRIIGQHQNTENVFPLLSESFPITQSQLAVYVIAAANQGTNLPASPSHGESVTLST